MRMSLKFSGGAVDALMLLVLLALPACTFQRSDGFPPAVANPLPHTTALFCDIEVRAQGTQGPAPRRCATPEDLATGIRLAESAVALARGDSGGNIGLDDSPEARSRCEGQPEAVVFRGPFPIGNPLCLNGMVVGEADPPLLFRSTLDACVAQCVDLSFGEFDDAGSWIPTTPVTPEMRDFCAARTRVSTNVPSNPNIGFPGACTPGGTVHPDFSDPRRVAQPVVWKDLINVTANGNDLQRTTSTGDQSFDAGAASTARFRGGDGFVEFSAAETNLSHIIGLSEFFVPPLGCIFNGCDDTDPSPNDITFGISLDRDKNFYVVERGAIVTDVLGADPVTGAIGTYNAGERFRVRLIDRGDGTASVIYARIVGTCAPGTPCTESIFHARNHPVRFPMRVSASFREVNATLTNVRVVLQ